jgi:hypothetical protein
MTTARFPAIRVGAVGYRATLKINRDTGLVSLRFHAQRAAYELHISEVAEMIYHRVSKERALKKALERKRGGGQ